MIFSDDAQTNCIPELLVGGQNNWKSFLDGDWRETIQFWIGEINREEVQGTMK